MAPLDFPFRSWEDALDPLYEPTPYPEPPAPPGPPQRGYLDRLALALSGVQGQPRNFGEGLAFGLARGFSGSRMQRMEHEGRAAEALREQQAETNRRNWQASEAARLLRARRTERALERAQQMAQQPKEPTLEEMLAGARQKATVESTIRSEFPELQPKQAPEPLVAVQTPEGPRFVPRSQAAGMPPAIPEAPPQRFRPPSAAERAELTGDTSILKQVQDIRKHFSRRFVGPLEGRVGGLRQITGVGARRDESLFRAALAGVRNQILKLRSGGAVTDSEAARLLQELPTTDDPDVVFQAKLDQFERTYTALANERRRTMSSTGVNLDHLPPLPTRGAFARDPRTGRLVRVR